MKVQSVQLSGWPSGMDNVHADHGLDAKTTENVDETGNAVKTSNLSRARTATIDWPGLEDEAQ